MVATERIGLIFRKVTASLKARIDAAEQPRMHAHVGEIYRDLKIAEIYEGANEVQKWIVARKIFGEDISG
jgi:alkylation response protein AidB-like acyl-CoA dehydrogenase